MFDFTNCAEHSLEGYIYRQPKESLLFIYESNKKMLERDAWNLGLLGYGLTEEETAARIEEWKAHIRYMCELSSSALKQKYDVDVR